MAVRTFYGTCKTASGESEKKVYVPDVDLIEEFNFLEGDLLVVFFAQAIYCSIFTRPRGWN